MLLGEAYNLFIRSEAIRSKFQGGYEAFMASIPNKTHITDGELDRVGFMSFEEMFLYARVLMGYGLKISRDFCLFNMIEGPMIPCNWINWLRYEWFQDSEHKITMVWLKPDYGGQENPESKDCPKISPDWWSPSKGIQADDFMNMVEINSRYKLVRKNSGGVLTYYDKLLDRIVYSS